ncbi:LysM domain-containing protein [Sinomonas flava]|uniref:LysM domain-containing protein n=1 Tax=Sinomonas flava TaxID=496857 RepID=A0ABN3BQV7_9MICC
MGFLDDVRKNIENAAEDVKGHLDDAIHRDRNDADLNDTGSPEPVGAPADPTTGSPADPSVSEAPVQAPGPAVAEPAAAEPAAAEPAAAQSASSDPAAEPSDSVPTGTREVVVEPGDTLSGIAEQFGVDLGALVAANADTVPDPDLIHPGQVLRLP